MLSCVCSVSYKLRWPIHSFLFQNCYLHWWLMVILLFFWCNFVSTLFTVCKCWMKVVIENYTSESDWMPRRPFIRLHIVEFNIWTLGVPCSLARNLSYVLCKDVGCPLKLSSFKYEKIEEGFLWQKQSLAVQSLKEPEVFKPCTSFSTADFLYYLHCFRGCKKARQLAVFSYKHVASFNLKF